MAQHQLGGFEADVIVARNRAVAGSVATSGAVYATPANYASFTAMDARLTAISGTLYPQSVLDMMTANDKVYAIRLNDDAATL